ncbi:MAG: CpsD/CapB family tyrosine-protein kinase [Anaerolineae bacterium]|nr:CpsD/CapB family tyrosine-protein kinase [Anaerolineae bacterium]
MPSELVTITDPRSPAAEAYRALRTNLEFAGLERPIRTLLVTSPGPEGGKSAVLANLAVVLAQAGKRIIVADCDLRHPRQHEIFGLANSAGLTTVLRDDAPFSSLPLADAGVAGLSVLTSGPVPPNPAELLSLPRLAEVVSSLSERADMVLFDAPPVVVVTDAAILAARVDGVLLAINARGTKRDHALRAKELLEKVNARLLGAVLNNVEFDASLRRYYAS